MNKYDVSGILNTYSQQVLNAKTDKELKEFIRRLKEELDLRKIEKFNER